MTRITRWHQDTVPKRQQAGIPKRAKKQATKKQANATTTASAGGEMAPQLE